MFAGEGPGRRHLLTELRPADGRLAHERVHPVRLRLVVEAPHRRTAPHPARVHPHDVEAREHLGCVAESGGGPDLSPRGPAGSARVDEQRPDPVLRVAGGQPRQRERDQASAGVVVVQRHPGRRALQAVAAVPPHKLRHPRSRVPYLPRTFRATPAYPVLVMNTRHDPITPVRNASANSGLLRGSRVLVAEGWGHGQITNGGPCDTGYLYRYLIDRTLPPPGTTCPAGVTPFTQGEKGIATMAERRRLHRSTAALVLAIAIVAATLAPSTAAGAATAVVERADCRCLAGRLRRSGPAQGWSQALSGMSWPGLAHRGVRGRSR